MTIDPWSPPNSLPDRGLPSSERRRPINFAFAYLLTLLLLSVASEPTSWTPQDFVILAVHVFSIAASLTRSVPLLRTAQVAMGIWVVLMTAGLFVAFSQGYLTVMEIHLAGDTIHDQGLGLLIACGIISLFAIAPFLLELRIKEAKRLALTQ